MLDDAGPPAEPAPARLQAGDLLRRARDRGASGSSTTRSGRAAPRASASRRRCRPPARSRTRSPRCSARRCAQLPMTPERVWAANQEERRVTRRSPPRPRSTRRSRRSPRARVPSPAAPTSWSAPARARRRCPTTIVAIDRIEGLARHPTTTDGRLVLGTLVTHEALVADATVRDAAHGDRRRERDRRLPRHARAGHDRRQRDERLAGDGHRRPAAVPRRDGDAALGDGGADARRSTSLDRARVKTVATPEELLTAVQRARCRRAGTGSAYVRLEYRRQMEIAVVGATAVVTVDGDRSPTRGSPSRRSPRRSAACPRPRRRWPAPTAAPTRSPRLRPRRPRRPPTPISDVRGSADYRTAMAEVDRAPRDRRRARRGPAAGPFPSPRAPRCTGPTEERSMKVTATLTVNGTTYPVELDPHVSLLEGGARGGRPHRLEGGLRRLRVRRLHDAARRQAGERVLLPGAAGRGPRGHDGRGPRRRRGARRRCSARSSSRAASNAGSARRACSSRRPRCCATTPIPPRRRSGSGCRATSAAAPATTASSAR